MNTKRTVYLDNNAATRIDNQVLESMIPWLTACGNAQSMHTVGGAAKDAIEEARSLVASFVGANPGEICFTASGSEANNLAIKGIGAAYAHKGKHLVVSGIEHFSVLNAARRLQAQGFEVTVLPVNPEGFVDPDALKTVLRSDTILVSIQMVNTEIGTIQPLKELVAVAHAAGILFHTDAVAAAAGMPIDVSVLGVDALTISASVFHGPLGAAALYLKKGVRVVPQIDGGVQEDGRRAGSENVAAIVGMGRACQIMSHALATVSDIERLRDRLISELPQRVPYAYLNGPRQKRAVNNVNFSIEFIEGESMLLFLDQAGIAVASGSACANKALKISHVLTAMQVDVAVGQGSLMLTLSKFTTGEDVDYFLDVFPPIVEKLRAMSPLYAHFQKTGKRMEAGPGTDFDHHHDTQDSCNA